MESLNAISPIDGRYRDKVSDLENYFSEASLIRYRVMIEIEYFISLCELPIPQLSEFQHEKFDTLRDIFINFTIEDAKKVKEIEAVTNHDVKAVEYFIREKFEELGLQEYNEFIHFGLTSQDINNTSLPCLFRDSIHNTYYPLIEELIVKLDDLSDELKDTPMLAKTHGQPASPTTMGKEIKVFVYRLQKQLELMKKVPISGKFGGATGNFNAHKVAYPEIDWVEFSNNFLTQNLKIEREQYTTQISNYDNLAAAFDNLKRINNIIIDLDRDFWTYISMEYFKQKIKAGEVGSSAMPHKVNPIDFENSEGNLSIANALFEQLANKLPISRLQRDLTDSTVTRNIGVPLGHTIISIKSTLKGLNKLIINKGALEKDLEKNWAVVAEAIQTILRRESYPDPYNALKMLTRTNSKITRESIREFIDELNVNDKIKEELKAISPQNYIGVY